MGDTRREELEKAVVAYGTERANCAVRASTEGSGRDCSCPDRFAEVMRIADELRSEPERGGHVGYVSRETLKTLLADGYHDGRITNYADTGKEVAVYIRPDEPAEGEREMECNVCGAPHSSLAARAGGDCSIEGCPGRVYFRADPEPSGDDSFARELARRAVQALADSPTPTEKALVGQDALQGTEAEACFVVEADELEQTIFATISNALFDGEIKRPEPSGDAEPGEGDETWMLGSFVRGPGNASFAVLYRGRVLGHLQHPGAETLRAAYSDLEQRLRRCHHPYTEAEGEPPRPEPPEGGWAPDSETPYVEGMPLMAWLSWKLRAAGVEEEDPLAGLLVEVATIATARDRGDYGYLASLVEQATRALVRRPHQPAGEASVADPRSWYMNLRTCVCGEDASEHLAGTRLPGDVPCTGFDPDWEHLYEDLQALSRPTSSPPPAGEVVARGWVSRFVLDGLPVRDEPINSEDIPVEIRRTEPGEGA